MRTAVAEPTGWLLAFWLVIEIAIDIGIEIGTRQGKTWLPIHLDTGSIWRPDPDFDLDGISLLIMRTAGG